MLDCQLDPPITSYAMSRLKHAATKLHSTVRIVSCLALARTFGVYEHSGWDGD